MYTAYAASPQGLSSPTASAGGGSAAAAAAAVHHHYPHGPYHPHPHHPYSASAASSPSTMTAIGSPSVHGAVGSLSGGYLTSPSGSSIQLMGSPSHNGAPHPLIGIHGAEGSHLQAGGGGLQDPHAALAMQMPGGSGGLIPAPSYDNGELAELKKRR